MSRYKVSGKTVTVRMATFLEQTGPILVNGIDTEDQRQWTLEHIQAANERLLITAGNRGTPIETIDSYSEGLSELIQQVIDKDVE